MCAILRAKLFMCFCFKQIFSKKSFDTTLKDSESPTTTKDNSICSQPVNNYNQEEDLQLFLPNCNKFWHSNSMPSTKEKERTDIGTTMERGDQTRSDQLESNIVKKSVVIIESRQSREKLLVVDMNKIRTKMHKNINKMNDEVVCDPSYQKQQLDYERHLDELGVNANQDKLSKVDQSDKMVLEGDYSEERFKILRAMAEKTIRLGLKKHGYLVKRKKAFVAEGGYGIVFRVHKSGKRYACKVISNMWFQLKTDRGPLNSDKLRSRFANEVDIMKRASSHPNIINFVECFSDYVKIYDKDNVTNCINDQHQHKQGSLAVSGDDTGQLVFKNFFLVMEYANSKTLSFYVKNLRCLAENIVKIIFRQLVDAVKFMHAHQIVHRDIKLSNLLLQSLDNNSGNGCRKSNSSTSQTFNYIVKLCDFGLSSVLKDGENFFIKPAGTSFYMSPEILRSYYFYNHKKFDHIVPYCAFKGDVWALGVCMFFCLHGFYPLDLHGKGTKSERMAELEEIFTISETLNLNKTVNEIYISRIRNALRNYHYKISFNGRELLGRMIEVDPNKRAEIFEVAQHLYLR